MANKPRKTFLKLLSHSTLTLLEEIRQLLHLSALPDKEPFRCAVDHLRLEMTDALRTLNSKEIDLTDFDRAITFYLENRNNKEYKAEIAMLNACTHALEADSIDARHVNLIVATYIDLALENERGLQCSKGGSKNKQLPGIEAAVTRILQSGKHDFSAERLWRYFEKNHSGRKNDFKVNNYRVFFGSSKKDEDEERLFQISPDKTIQSIGRSAFAGYVKSAKKN